MLRFEPMEQRGGTGFRQVHEPLHFCPHDENLQLSNSSVLAAENIFQENETMVTRDCELDDLHRYAYWCQATRGAELLSRLVCSYPTDRIRQPLFMAIKPRSH